MGKYMRNPNLKIFGENSHNPVKLNTRTEASSDVRKHDTLKCYR